MRKEKNYKIHLCLQFDRWGFKVDKATEDDVNIIIKRIKHYPGLMVEKIVGSDWYMVVGAEFVLYRALYTLYLNQHNTLVFEREML